MNILQKIFTDHYEEIKYTLHPRDTEMENIEKMIHCGDPSFGGAMYHCPHCGNFKYVPFHCHSRFCPSCGNKYSMERTTSMTFKLINVKHRHCVFTIDENLRDFFLKERSLLDCLFHSVASVISHMFFELNKSVYPLVKRRYEKYGTLLPMCAYNFRLNMYKILNKLGIEKHTPHDCRHTFSKLCEDNHVNENDRKRMIGHAFGNDVTNRVYGHRDLRDLRIEIEKIDKECFVTLL